MANTYRSAALESASAVELVVALYDGLIQRLHDAAEASQQGDVRKRREAAKKALDIIIHLQATLRPEVGGKPAAALSEFYVSIFALILRASLAAAPGEFQHAVRCVRTVREAWQQVAIDPTVKHALPFDMQTNDERNVAVRKASTRTKDASAGIPEVLERGEAPASNWTA